MQAYLAGAIPQLIARAEALERKIRSNLPADYLALATVSRDALIGVQRHLAELLSDPKYQNASVQAERLRSFRRSRKLLTQIESRAIATLDREKKEDLRLNALVRRIVAEINHVPLPPVVSPLSQMYFSMDTTLNILFVPLIENRFLLHLPDVYHELAHQCFADRASSRLRPVTRALRSASEVWLQNCFNERQRLMRSRGPEARRHHVELAQRCTSPWILELFCDLYAVLTVGPAYGWSHLHLTALFGDSPYALPVLGPSSHPADDARMRVIIGGLKALHYDVETHDIEQRWTQFKASGGYTPSPEYHLYYPTDVLQAIVEEGIGGFESAGTRGYKDAPSDSVARILNQAWQRFWSDPTGYVAWEQRAVDSLLSEQPTAS